MPSYKIAHVTTVYKGFSTHFQQSEGIEEWSYATCLKNLCAHRFGSSDYHATYFTQFGHEAIDIFANVELLQKKWATENGVSFTDNWYWEIVFAQLKAFNPDVVYLPDLYIFDAEKRQAIRGLFPHKKLKILGWRFAPTPDFKAFGDLDLIASGNKEWQGYFKPHCKNSVFIPIGFEPKLREEVKALSIEKTAVDFSFIGSVGKPEGMHFRRYQILEKLLANTNLQVWGAKASNEVYGAGSKIKNALLFSGYKTFSALGLGRLANKIPFIRRAQHWQMAQSSIPLSARHANSFHGAVFGLDNYALLSRSRLVFNKHINVVHEYGGNIRMFESTGMGACLLTDHLDGVNEFFEPDSEILTYKSTEEAIEKANYILENESERKKIALAGQKRTLKDYTTEQHMQKLDYYIQKYLLT